jgi:pSer/pThr/pTyr-binding forkhead associated (FHA) protein
MRAKLTIARGSNKGKEFEITGPQFVIGRAAGCNLRPQSDAISRQHCAVFNKGDRITIKDLGSRNGSILNGEKLTAEEELKTGDELVIGPLHFNVVVMDDAGAVQQPPGPDVHEHEISGLPSDSGLISDFLLKEDEAAKRQSADHETRQFQLDESDLIKLDDEDVEEGTKKKKKAKKEKKKKKEPGKLPSAQADNASNSRDAAAETLKKLFNRGM